MKKSIISLLFIIFACSFFFVFNNGFAVSAEGDFRQKDFFIEDQNLTVLPHTNSQNYLWLGDAAATGLVVKKENPSGTIYTKAIQANYLFSSDNYILRLAPCSYSFTSLSIRLIDADNSLNYVSVSWTNGDTQKIFGGWNNNEGYVYTVPVGCNESVSYFNTQNAIANKDVVWSYGTMFQYERPTEMLANENYYWQFHTDMNHDGTVDQVFSNNGWTDYFFIKVNNNKLITARGQYDISDSKVLNAERLRVEISWTSNNGNDGVSIKNIFGKDMVSGTTDVVDIDKNLISDFGEDIRQEELFAEDPNLTVLPHSTSSDYLWIDDACATGLVVRNKNPKGTIYTKAIQANYLFSSDNYILRLAPCSYSFTSLSIRLIDADDVSNCVSVSWTNGDTQRIFGGWNGNENYVYTVPVGCNEYVSYLNNQNATVNKDVVWSYGTMLQYERPTEMLHNGDNAYYQFYTDMNHDGTADQVVHDNYGVWTDYFFIKVKNNKLITARGQYDISDSKVLNAERVRVEISWKSDDGNDGVSIKNIFGKDVVSGTTGIVNFDKNLISDVDIDIELVHETAALIDANDNITLLSGKKNGVNYLYDCDGIDYRSYTGLVATSDKTTGSIRYKNAVDLSVFTKNDLLVRLIPYLYDVNALCFKLIDVNNANNYVEIKYTPSQTMTYTNTYGTCSIGSDCIITYYYGSDYQILESKYEYGLILGKWDPLLVQFGNEGGVGLDITGSGSTVWAGPNPDFNDAYYIEHFSIAYESGKVYTARNAYELNGFAGFSDNLVYLEISWESAAAGNGVNIDTLLGVNTYEYALVDDAPVIRAPDALSIYVDEHTDMFDIKVFDIVDGKIDTYTYRLLYNNNGVIEDESARIINNSFLLDKLGKWIIEISASDLNGKTSVKNVIIDCVVKPLSFTWDTEFNRYYFLGESFEFLTPLANMDANKYTFSYTVKKNNSIISNSDMIGLITDSKLGAYVVYFTAESIYGSLYEKEFAVYFCTEPEFASNFTCEVDDGPSDIDFPVLYDGWILGFIICEKNDTQFSNPISWSHINVGTYNIKIIVSIPERNKEYTRFSTLTVKESTKPVVPDEGGVNPDEKPVVPDGESGKANGGGCSSAFDFAPSAFVISSVLSLIFIVIKRKIRN